MHRLARTSSAAAAVVLLSANVMLPATAVAIVPPGVDPAALPPDDTPGPDQEMKQQNTCADPLTVVTPDVAAAAPGNVMLDIAKAWKYSTGAGVTVGMIDTGVTPNPRFPALFAGGDYVMGDDLRTVHWRASARSDELKVRQHTTEGVRRCIVVLDRDAGALRRLPLLARPFRHASRIPRSRASASSPPRPTRH